REHERDPGEQDDREHRLGAIGSGLVAVVAEGGEHRARVLEHEQRAQPPVARPARRLSRNRGRRCHWVEPSYELSVTIWPSWQRYSVWPRRPPRCAAGALPSRQIVWWRLWYAAAIPATNTMAQAAPSRSSTIRLLCQFMPRRHCARAARAGTARCTTPAPPRPPRACRQRS